MNILLPQVDDVTVAVSWANHGTATPMFDVETVLRFARLCVPWRQLNARMSGREYWHMTANENPVDFGAYRHRFPEACRPANGYSDGMVRWFEAVVDLFFAKGLPFPVYDCRVSDGWVLIESSPGDLLIRIRVS